MSISNLPQKTKVVIDNVAKGVVVEISNCVYPRAVWD